MPLAHFPLDKAQPLPQHTSQDAITASNHDQTAASIANGLPRLPDGLEKLHKQTLFSRLAKPLHFTKRRPASQQREDASTARIQLPPISRHDSRVPPAHAPVQSLPVEGPQSAVTEPIVNSSTSAQYTFVHERPDEGIWPVLPEASSSAGPFVPLMFQEIPTKQSQRKANFQEDVDQDKNKAPLELAHASDILVQKAKTEK